MTYAAFYGVERPLVVKPSVPPTCEWYLVPSRYEFIGTILLSRILAIRDIAAAKSQLTHRFAARCCFIEFRCTFALFCFTCCKRAPFGFDLGKNTGFAWADALLGVPLASWLGIPGFWNLHVLLVCLLSIFGTCVVDCSNTIVDIKNNY